MFVIILILALLLISPATLLLSTRVLGVYDTTLTRCLTTSIVLSLIAAAYALFSRVVGITQHESLHALVNIVLCVLILGWRLQIGYLRSLGVTLLWGVLLIVSYVMLAFALGIADGDWSSMLSVQLDKQDNAATIESAPIPANNTSVLSED